jgi:hypothetical protein
MVLNFFVFREKTPNPAEARKGAASELTVFVGFVILNL